MEDNDDMFFDAQNYSSSNKNVANILQKDSNTSATGTDSQDASDK